tara:strand:+ start:442 stop:624 length:183 start_codon:yes stop_codon:yes gene_type:complete
VIRIELSDEEVEYSTSFHIDDPHDIMYSFEEMVRSYTKADLEVDGYILERAKEIKLKNSN